MTALGTARPTRGIVNTPLRASGALLLLLAAGMAVAGLVEAADGGDDVGALLGSAALCGGLGALLWRATRLPHRVSAASALSAVACAWVVACLAGALPFALSGVFDALDDALFESVAGFTTTNATLLGSDGPVGDGLLLWRSLLQWTGGLAAVVLAVSVLPLLGVGGLEMVRQDAPTDPARTGAWLARVFRRTAPAYAALTAAVALGLLVSGAGLFTAVTLAMGALSTGGFVARAVDTSIPLEAVLIAGMLAGGAGFALHRRDRPDRFTGLGVFAGWLVAAVALVVALDGHLRQAVFSVVSMATTTGFQTVAFSAWTPAVQLVLLMLVLTGAMTGSASGGMKLLRMQVVLGYARRELRRARHPRGIFPLRVGGATVPETAVAMVAGFVALYLLAFLVGVLALAALGADLLTALGAAGSALANAGPGPGEVATPGGYAALSRPAHAVLDALMLVGRVEIFPLLLAFVAPGRALARRRNRPA